jgi:RNA polymerase sigma factor (sigma-70 family)
MDALSPADVRLVRDCLRGREEAWEALLDKYKNLIYSIPTRQGIPRDSAADIFQRVCVLLLAELPHLRQAQALPMWLIRVTARECTRWRRQERPGAVRDARTDFADVEDDAPLPEAMLAQLDSEQALRDAVRGLKPRCRELVEMLFFETPSRPYRDVARVLGLAEGSIGFIRGRCLARLTRALRALGIR